MNPAWTPRHAGVGHADGNQEQITYDHTGRLRTMKTWQNFAGDAGAATTTWNYHTSRGWMISKEYDDGSGPSFSYHPSGKIKTRTWQSGVVTTYGYNTTGDPASTDYSDATADISYVYDRRGRQTFVNQGGDRTALAYNLAGGLLTESYTAGPLAGITVTNTYDSLLRRSHLEFLDGSSAIVASTQYGYAASRLNTVTDGTNAASYSYLANSRLVEKITFAHDGSTNMATTKSYDFINRLSSIAHEDAQSGTIASYDYTHDAANQRTNVTLADDSYWTYSYGSAGQLSSGKKRDDHDALIANRQFEYDYDDIGNRTEYRLDGTAGGVLQSTNSYTANLLNQYTNIAGTTRIHDLDGNLTNDSDWIYTWNGENRLVVLESSANVPAANRKKLKFAYDHRGRRIRKEVSTWDVPSSSYLPSTTNLFVYDGWNLIAELDANTNLAKGFTWGLDLSGTEQGAGGTGGLLLVTDLNSSHFVAHDGNGNVTRLVDTSTGTESAAYTYSPFGQLIATSGTAANVNPFRFSAKYEDDEDGMYYYGYRYYNPSTGRWLNRDPLGGDPSATDVNQQQILYAFVDNEPISNTDIFGLIKWNSKKTPPGQDRSEYTDRDGIEWWVWHYETDRGKRVEGFISKKNDRRFFCHGYTFGGTAPPRWHEPVSFPGKDIRQILWDDGWWWVCCSKAENGIIVFDGGIGRGGFTDGQISHSGVIESIGPNGGFTPGQSWIWSKWGTRTRGPDAAEKRTTILEAMFYGKYRCFKNIKDMSWSEFEDAMMLMIEGYSNCCGRPLGERDTDFCYGDILK